MKRFLVLLPLVLALGAHAQAELPAPTNDLPTVILGWTIPPWSGNITNCYIWYGTNSLAYTARISVGLVTNYTLTLPLRGPTYYLACTDQDASGMESKFSNEVVFTTVTPPPEPTNAKVIGGKH